MLQSDATSTHSVQATSPALSTSDLPASCLSRAHHPRNAGQIGHDFDLRPILAEQGKHLVAHIVADLDHHKAAGLERPEGLREEASIDFVSPFEVPPQAMRGSNCRTSRWTISMSRFPT